MKAKASDNATKEMVCGCTAGLADAISGFPFDTIKVRLQAEPGRYTGVWQCFTDIWRKEGVSTQSSAETRCRKLDLQHWLISACMTRMAPPYRSCRAPLAGVCSLPRDRSTIDRWSPRNGDQLPGERLTPDIRILACQLMQASTRPCCAAAAADCSMGCLEQPSYLIFYLQVYSRTLEALKVSSPH